MKVTLNRELYLQVLFMVAVIVPFFNNYELSFITWFLISVITVKTNYDLRFVKYISYFIIIFLLSLFIGFFFKYNLFYTIRDITYLLKPVFGLLLGYQLFSSQIKNPFRFLVYAGITIASYHLFLVIYGFVFEGARSVREIREIAGYFNDFEVYALIILIFHKQFKLEFSKKTTTLFLIILAFSSFFYLARTNFIQFIILYFAMKGWLVLNKKSLAIIFSLISVSILGYIAIYNYNPRRNGDGLDEFLYKLKVLPEEALSTKINRNDWKDFHDHYRSYEIVRTIEQLTHNETYLFGEGIGSQVDLKQKVYLGDMELRHISILHNGYMTVFLKSGILGTLFLLISILFFFSKFKKVNELDDKINVLFKGTGYFLIISYWVFLGFYNLIDTKTLLIGFLFAYKHNLTKLNENNINHTPIG